MTRRHAAAMLAAVALAAAGCDGDDENATPDQAAGFVPADAAAYVHLSTDRDGKQWRRAGDAVGRLPALESLVERLTDQLSESEGVEVRRDVLPWLGDEAASVFVPGAGETPALRRYSVLAAGNRGGADRFVARVGPATKRVAGAQLHGTGNVAAASTDGFVVLGPPDLVSRALAAHARPQSSLLRERRYRDELGRLPARRLAHVYISPVGARTPDAEGSGPLERAGLTEAAASLSVEGDQARIALRTRHAARPRGCAAKNAPLRLLDSVPERAVGYIGAPSLSCALEAAGLEGLGRLGEEARRAGVDIARDVMPLLQGEGALTTTTGRDTPALTLLVDRVAQGRALEVLGRLQPALVRLFDTPALDQVPDFAARRIAGVSVRTAQVGPELELSYAAFDGRLALSTQPGGIAAVRGEGGLESSDAFRDVLPDRPERPSALVFLDLDRLLALGEQVGLDEDPTYLTVRDDLQKLGAVGAFLSREGEHTTAELRFNIP